MTTHHPTTIALCDMPQEIIDLIVTHTQPDLQTAKACALVTRSWTEISQKFYLSHIRVDDITSERLCTFLSNNQESARLRRYAKHVSYDISYPVKRYKSGADMSVEDARIRTIFQSLPYLESLSIDNVGQIMPIVPSVTRGTLELFKNSKLQALELTGVAFPTTALFLKSLCGSRIHRLRIEDVRAALPEDETTTMGNQNVNLNDPTVIHHLTELSLRYCYRPVMMNFFINPAIFNLTGLRILRIDCVHSSADHSLPIIRRLRSILLEAPFLEELFLSFCDIDLLPQGHELLTLQKCHRLQVLTVELWRGYSRLSDVFFVVAELLRSISATAPLMSISLETDCWTDDEDDEDDAQLQQKWALVEQALLPVDGENSLDAKRPQRSLHLLFKDGDQVVEVPEMSKYMPRLNRLGLLRLCSP